ncbi:MAG TPA: methylated-DNA--[protein]-cysteine S-methyltransferase [Geobacteraceae bacterium]
MMKRRERHPAAAYRSLFTTELGVGGVVASGEGLLEVFLPFGEGRETIVAQIAARYPAATNESPLTKKAADLLARYFAGEPIVFGLPIDRQGFTPFQWTVYAAVMAIPAGETKSYSQVATEIGRPHGARGIGGAMARNPIPVVIPCHRVVGKSGKMTGYSAPGGVVSKEWLLAMEKRVAKKTK